jgi:hypothetical protein
MDSTMLLILFAALLLGGGKKAQAAPNRRSPEEEAAADGAALVRRASQGSRWASLFQAAGVDAATAEALARWAGIESGGNPLAVSKLGERGLLQCMESTGLRGKIFSPGEWVALSDPATSDTTHAQLAVKLFRAMWAKAKPRVKDAPTNPIDQVFYAKLMHQWPRDFWDEKMHGPALPMAAELAQRWAGKPKSTHRLRAAAVVAFGVPEPWRTGNA